MTKKKKISLLLAVVIILTTALVITLHLLTQKADQVIVEEIKPTTVETQEIPKTINPQIIGTSVEKRPIENYTYGQGGTTLLFVGGVHGGYEWNSVLLAYAFIDEIESGNLKIPEGIKVEIIPALNPDGVFRVTGKEGRFTPADVRTDTKNGEGRFNANGVDLNRNFACKWQPNSTWRNQKVSAGASAFSEPEAQALKKLVENKNPTAVIFWHSQANAVYASECEKGILPETLKLMDTYAKASGYKAISAFDAYPVTGDAEGWLASINIPAITVEMSTHENIEWVKNKAGVEAILELYQ
ncbi:MAG: Gamma-D-glutamyl-L-diamino acid endopeptidase 1 [Parcubacteria bacterium OLB19]|nr:MAG: Gamma-D-glutamyl-L-diamino acid endopeptidase 1 [Parcubacteria bacterium OLB19]